MVQSIQDEIKIAIIMPCTQPDYIVNRALSHIKNQTAKDNIIIYMINDSTNNYLSLIDSYKELKIKYYQTDKQRSGPSVARNIGLSHCTEDYIIFCDDDDWLYDKYVIENYIKIIQENKYKKISAVHFSIKEQRFEEKVERIASEEYKFCFHGKLYYKKFLDEYNIRFNEKLKYRFEDNFFAIQTYLYSIKNDYDILFYDHFYCYVLYHDKEHKSLAYNNALLNDKKNYLSSINFNINLFHDIIFYQQIILLYKEMNDSNSHKKEIYNILKYFYINCNNILLLLQIYGFKNYTQEELNNFKEAVLFLTDLVNKNKKTIQLQLEKQLNFNMAGYETSNFSWNNFDYFTESFERKWNQII